MTQPRLTTVVRTQGNSRALKEGSIAPRTCLLEFDDAPGLIDAFRRMVRGMEFDVCEMALSTYVYARAHGKRFTALPIFPVRAFHHGAIVCGRAAGARIPKDLEGREVGVNRGYTVTTGVWARSILQREYGVDLDRITWILSGDEHVAEYKLPSNVLPIAPGRKMSELVASGELAAGIGIEADSPGLRLLIPGAAEAGFTALREHAHYPINHLIVVKDEILDAHPGVATDLFDAFARAKRGYVEALKSGRIEASTPADDVYRRVMEITGKDPLPYGIEPNRQVLEGFLQDLAVQRIIDRPVGVDELFHPETRSLVG